MKILSCVQNTSNAKLSLGSSSETLLFASQTEEHIQLKKSETDYVSRTLYLANKLCPSYLKLVKKQRTPQKNIVTDSRRQRRLSVFFRCPTVMQNIYVTYQYVPAPCDVKSMPWSGL